MQVSQVLFRPRRQGAARGRAPKLPIWKVAGRGKRRSRRVVAATPSPVPRHPTGIKAAGRALSTAERHVVKKKKMFSREEKPVADGGGWRSEDRLDSGGPGPPVRFAEAQTRTPSATASSALLPGGSSN